MFSLFFSFFYLNTSSSHDIVTWQIICGLLCCLTALSTLPNHLFFFFLGRLSPQAVVQYNASFFQKLATVFLVSRKVKLEAIQAEQLLQVNVYELVYFCTLSCFTELVTVFFLEYASAIYLQDSLIHYI